MLIYSFEELFLSPNQYLKLANRNLRASLGYFDDFVKLRTCYKELTITRKIIPIIKSTGE